MTAAEDPGRAGSGTPPSRRPRRRIAALAAGAVAVAAIAGGLTWAFTSGHLGSSAPASAAIRSHVAAKPTPVRVLSVIPVQGAAGVNGGAPVTVVFSAPLAAGSPMPTFSPAVAGTWAPVKAKLTAKSKTKTRTRTGARPKKAAASQDDEMVFTPATGFRPDSTVTLNIPAGPSGVRSTTGGLLASSVSTKFRTGSYSTLRLQQLLAQLGYLPLTWTPSGTSIPAGDTNAQYSAAYSPPAGTFTWQSGYPSALQDLWQQGADNIIDVGAIRAFESVEGLTMDGVAGPAVWRDLLHAAAGGQDNPNGYSYAFVSKGDPETLTLYHDGHVVLHTLANTGIPEAPTADGTYPVYERLPFQIMQGTNPDGSHYADPVENVSYFDGGEAVHYFPRGSYGWPQSLGCVELPLPQSAVAYRYLTYGSLVTVSPY